MRDASIACLREIGVDTGGSNVQFAVNPADGRMVVIEMNPRVSRSSALASKATGFPIAKIAAKLAVGYTLDEMLNDITSDTPASFEPTIDYVVTKIPRFTFEKFPGADAAADHSMKSVGEAMAIGRTFEESLQKGCARWRRRLPASMRSSARADERARRVARRRSRCRRPSVADLAQALRAWHDASREARGTANSTPGSCARSQEIVEAERAASSKNGLPKTRLYFCAPQAHGFLRRTARAALAGQRGSASRTRARLGVIPVYKRVDTCAAEFASPRPTCTRPTRALRTTGLRSHPTARKKVIILGGGPEPIGQGIEFDYCCVHAAYALKGPATRHHGQLHPETSPPTTTPPTASILSRSPPRTSSTIPRAAERPLRRHRAVRRTDAAQARPGARRGRRSHLGTSPDAIDLAEDRERFQQLLQKLGLRQPDNACPLRRRGRGASPSASATRS